MATAATIKKNIAKLEAALKSKATPKTLKPKLEAQLVKSKAELSGINKGTKPKTSSTKSTQTALQKLKEMVNKNKKFKTYKGAGVDLEKDADRPALRTGKRIAKESGKTYYEYRANRIDVKQPPKKYPKLEKGGYMAKGGNVTPKDKLIKELQKLQTQLNSSRLSSYKEGDNSEEEMARQRERKSKLDRFNEILQILKEDDKMAKGGYMAKGGETLMMGDEEVYIKKSSIGLEDEVCLFYKKDDSILKCISKNQFDKFIEQGKLVPKKEQGGYMAKGGYFAKGGLTEHGLKVGDTIVDDMFWDKSVKVLNSKTGYAVVKIETGERKEMKAMGGEMHRTQE
jgi:hypothetical protein